MATRARSATTPPRASAARRGTTATTRACARPRRTRSWAGAPADPRGAQRRRWLERQDQLRQRGWGRGDERRRLRRRSGADDTQKPQHEPALRFDFHDFSRRFTDQADETPTPRSGRPCARSGAPRKDVLAKREKAAEKTKSFRRGARAAPKKQAGAASRALKCARRRAPPISEERRREASSQTRRKKPRRRTGKCLSPVPEDASDATKKPFGAIAETRTIARVGHLFRPAACPPRPPRRRTRDSRSGRISFSARSPPRGPCAAAAKADAFKLEAHEPRRRRALPRMPPPGTVTCYYSDFEGGVIRKPTTNRFAVIRLVGAQHSTAPTSSPAGSLPTCTASRWTLIIIRAARCALAPGEPSRERLRETATAWWTSKSLSRHQHVERDPRRARAAAGVRDPSRGRHHNARSKIAYLVNGWIGHSHIHNSMDCARPLDRTSPPR